MQSLIIAARAVIPVTLIMILGAITRKLGTVSEKSFKDLVRALVVSGVKTVMPEGTAKVVVSFQ